MRRYYRTRLNKILMAISVLLVGYFILAIIKRKEFHVTVECYGFGLFLYYYNISYHEGILPFYHSGDIMDAFDISTNIEADNWVEKVVLSSTGYGVEHQLWLSRNKSEAIRLAKSITCYDSAAAYNERVLILFFELAKYRNSHPVYVTVKKSTNCCTGENIY